MPKFVAAKPIQNRRMNLKPGDPVPALFSTAEAIKQIKALHGEDCVRMVEYRRPGENSADDEGLDPLVLDALEMKVAEQEKQLRDQGDQLKSQGEMIGSQHRRIAALEKALAEKDAARAPANETAAQNTEKPVDPSMRKPQRR